MGHDPHVLYTLSAVQILAIARQLDRLDAKKVAAYVASLQQVRVGEWTRMKWHRLGTDWHTH